MRKKKMKKPNNLLYFSVLISLIVFSVFIWIFTVFVGIFMLVESPCFSQKISNLTIKEQKEHQESVLELIQKTKEDADSAKDILEKDIAGKETDSGNDEQNQDDLYDKIDDLEKDSLILDESYDKYITDISINVNPYRDMEIEKLIYHSQDLSLKNKRLARILENYLYTGKNPDQNQLSLIDRAFANVYWEIARFDSDQE